MRLKALDGWRGVACLLVALYHLNVTHSFWTAPWLVQPEVVLELFFLLSGFVMAMSFADSVQNTRTFFAFIIHRFGRAMPVHLFTLGLLLVLVGLKTLSGANHGGFSQVLRPEALLPQLFAMQTIAGHGLSWNYPAWTMSAELMAYLVFAVLVWLLRERTHRLIGAAVIVVISAFFFHADLTATPSNGVSVVRCFTAFFFGFIVYDFWRALPKPSPKMSTALQASAVVAIVSCLFVHFEGWDFFIYHFVCGALIFAFAHEQGLVARLMATAPLLWLGKMSFSLYMVHAVVMTYLQTAFFALERLTGREFITTHITPLGVPRDMISLGPVWANDLLMVAYLAAVIGAAMLLYRWVETPARHTSTDLAKRYKNGELKLSWASLAAAFKRRSTGVPH